MNGERAAVTDGGDGVGAGAADLGGSAASGLTGARATGGDADLSRVGALLAEPARCRILLALDDGRALPASRLAAEAGVSASTASSHLGRLVDGGLLMVETHGRFRYYRLAGPHVGRLIETLAALAPTQPVRSLRESTRAHALRQGRTCYDHLAGRVGVAVMTTFVDRAYLIGGDGSFDPDRAEHDRLSAPGRDVDYQLTDSGWGFLDELGVELPPRRRTVRYCVDWTEQRHHLSGGLGQALLSRFTSLGWVCRSAGSRAVRITDAGRDGLGRRLDVRLDA